MSHVNTQALLPAWLGSRFRQGALLVEGGHLDAAEEVYSEVIAVRPDTRDAWYRRAIVRALLGKTEASAQDLLFAERLDCALAPTPPQSVRSRWAAAVA